MYVHCTRTVLKNCYPVFELFNTDRGFSLDSAIRPVCADLALFCFKLPIHAVLFFRLFMFFFIYWKRFVEVFFYHIINLEFDLPLPLL
jgi:hypothetical protein